MRKITSESVKAFFSGRKLNKQNMEVRVNEYSGVTELYLHGNLIAKRILSTVTLYDCGWLTTTTKERLNGLLDYMSESRIYQKKGVWYRGEKIEWVSGTTFERNY